MTFIKLSDLNNGKQIIVNMDNVGFISEKSIAQGRNGSIITFAHGNIPVLSKESPQEILALLANAAKGK